MPQPNDLSRSLVALDQNSTIIAVVELSQSSWLVAGVLLGIERQPCKKLDPSPERLLAVLHRWRDETVRAGPLSRGLRLPSRPAATAFGWRLGGEDRIRRVHSCQQVQVRIQFERLRRERAWPHRRSQTR
jgi:transposase